MKTAEGTTSQGMAMGSSSRDLAPAWERASTEARSQSLGAADLTSAEATRSPSLMMAADLKAGAAAMSLRAAELAAAGAAAMSLRAADLPAGAAAARGMEWAGRQVLERRWAQQWARPWAAGWNQRLLQQQK